MPYSAGIPKARVVAVQARLKNGRSQVGTGFIIDTGLILTAAHCTQDSQSGDRALSLRVIRATDGADVSIDLDTVVRSADLDIAVIRLRKPGWTDCSSRTTFARVRRENSGELTRCSAIGYPLFQFDERNLKRSTAELYGTINQTDEHESDRLLMQVDRFIPPAGDHVVLSQAKGPWGGLSGAVVFYRGDALGVIVEHHPRQGATSLQLVPFDAIARDASNSGVAQTLGLSPADLRQAVVPYEDGIGHAIPARAVEARHGGERVVDIAQRITLDRDLSALVVRSDEFDSPRLERAEFLLLPYVTPYIARRAWTLISHSVTPTQMELQVLRLRADDAALRPSIVVDGRAMQPTDARIIVDVHRQACQTAGMTPGPVVVFGVSRFGEGDPHVIALSPTAYGDRERPNEDDEIEAALKADRYAEVLSAGRYATVPLLSAIWRCTRDDAPLLERLSSPIIATANSSVRKAWDALKADSFDNPDIWRGASRDFVALILRSDLQTLIPFSQFDREVLREQFFWDEIMRLPPSALRFSELAAIPQDILSSVGLLNDRTDAQNLGDISGGSEK